MAMANRAGDDGTGIWESMPNLAKHGGLSERTGWRALPKLLKSGLVLDTGNGKPTKRGGSPTIIYRINLAKLASIKCEKNQISKLPECQDDTLEGCQSATINPQSAKMTLCQSATLVLPECQNGRQISPIISPCKSKNNDDVVVDPGLTGKAGKARGSDPLISAYRSPCPVCHVWVEIGEEITLHSALPSGKPLYRHFSCSPPAPKPVPDPACKKCRGTGQLKARFVKVEGQRCEQTVIPDCDCLHVSGVEK
jgi:hypothetical protein